MIIQHYSIFVPSIGVDFVLVLRLKIGWEGGVDGEYRESC